MSRDRKEEAGVQISRILFFTVVFGFSVFCSINTGDLSTHALATTSYQDILNKDQQGEEPQPPEIFSPAEREEFRNITRMTFEWKKAANVAGYHLILAKDRKFKQIIHENAHITTSTYTIGDLETGTYFFKISSLGQDGFDGPFSETRTFLIVPPPPSGTPITK